MIDVIVIGAGIVGASVAYRLSQVGTRVTVLEATRPAAGTSANSFAWVNANEKPPRAYHDLNAAGVVEHHRLAAELPGSGFQPTGHLEWATDPAGCERLRQRVARLQNWGYPADLTDRETAQALVPDLRLPAPGAAEYAAYAEEGWVAAPTLIAHLLAGANRRGARLVYQAPVEHLLVENERVTGVLAAGETYQADLVIDCTGPTAGRLLEPLGLSVRRQPSPGLTVVTAPAPTLLDRVIHAPGVYVRPDGGGRVLIGSEEIDGQLDREQAATERRPDSPLAAELLRRAQALLAGLEGVGMEAVRLGWRALPGDGLSAVGPVPGLSGYYLVFTHSAITLGPLLGRLVAAEVTTGQPAPEVLPFRPDRLVGAAIP